MALSESGYGVEVYIGNAAGDEEAFVYVDGLTDAKPPAIVKLDKKRRDIHRRPTDPDYGSARFVLSKISDYGEIPLKLDRDTADPGQAALIAAGKARARVWYKFVFPQAEGGGGFKFVGLITDLEPSTPVDGPMEYDIKLQVTSKPIEVA